jgi:uncharacterized protein (TIGR04141 family)
MDFEEKDEKQTITASIYLFKEVFLNSDVYIKYPDFCDKKDVSLHGITGTVYVKKRKRDLKPSWSKTFYALTGFTDADITTSSAPAAVYIFSIHDQKIGLTFGSGNYLLKDEYIVQDFGVKACLANAGENSFEGIQFVEVERGVHKKIEQSSQAGPISDYEMNGETGIFGKATTIPANSKIEKHMTGKTSLKDTIFASYDEIYKILYSSIDNYFKEDFSKKYPWLNNVSYIHDQQTIKTLWSSLIDDIKSGKTSKLSISYPDIIDWDKLVGFAIGRNPGIIQYDAYIDDDGYFKRIKEKDDIISVLENDYLCCCTEDEVPQKACSIKNALVYECNINNKFYALYSGKWYSIGNSLVDKMKQLFNGIDVCNGLLPPCEKRKEEDYNKDVANGNKQFVLFDKKLVYIETPTGKFEICDLYDTVNHYYIHVKKETGSGKLSHLFKQGENAADLLLNEAEARQKIINEFHKQGAECPYDTNKFSLVYCIISRNATRIEDLPLFSQISLYNTMKSLSRMKVKVKLCFVKENYKKQK